MSGSPDLSRPGRHGAAGRARSRRDTRTWAAAGAATVAAIYAIGYGATSSGHGGAGRAARAAAPRAGSAAAAGPSPTTGAATTTAGASRPSGGYRDGRFTGTGSSPYGEISVAVDVRGRRVTSVEVTSATTFFPASDVAPLVPEVIARQSANVDVVSGATGSSDAFQGAIQQALANARR